LASQKRVAELEGETRRLQQALDEEHERLAESNRLLDQCAQPSGYLLESLKKVPGAVECEWSRWAYSVCSGGSIRA
jgi:hypothetical protein